MIGVRKLLTLILRSLVSMILLLVLANFWVVLTTRSEVYSFENDLPHKKVALVLGTTNKLSTGKDNPYFSERMKTASLLYQKGIVDHFILSGANNSVYYNEPEMMKEALISKGVPEDMITLDNAGFRTLDSIVRCKEIFGQDNVIIITQKFHSYRALFISRYYGLKAIAIEAENVPFPSSLGVTIREIIARPLAIIDLYILKTRPRVLGEKEYI